MSKVTQVTVRYGRSVQPKPYESKEGLLEAVLVADEGEDIPTQDVEALFATIITDVHTALGVDVVGNKPPKDAKKPAKSHAKKPASAEPIDEVPIAGETDANDIVNERPRDTSTDEIDDSALQGTASRAAAKHGAAQVKALMAEFDVAQLGKLTQEQRVEFAAKIEELDNA